MTHLTTDELLAPLRWIERHGTLAERLQRSVSARGGVSREHLRAVYGELSRALVEGRLFA